MQKSNLGISVGLLGAFMFLACFFGGYIPAILLAGYILLREENLWLKKSAVKGIVLMVAFSLVVAVINLLPNAISLINSTLHIFGGHFYIEFISNIVSLITESLDVLKKVLFIILGLKALNQGTIKIPVIDSLVNKYMD